MLKCAENDTKNPPRGTPIGVVLGQDFTYTPSPKLGYGPSHSLSIIYKGVLKIWLADHLKEKSYKN